MNHKILPPSKWETICYIFI